MAENEVDMLLEFIDFDQDIEIEVEKWDENAVEIDEEDIDVD